MDDIRHLGKVEPENLLDVMVGIRSELYGHVMFKAGNIEYHLLTDGKLDKLLKKAEDVGEERGAEFFGIVSGLIDAKETDTDGDVKKE